MNNRITPEGIEAKIQNVTYHVVPGTTVTICNVILENGFSVQGTSACADPTLFNSNLGEQYSREDAFNKIWPLEGYLLKERLYQESKASVIADPLSQFDPGVE